VPDHWTCPKCGYSCSQDTCPECGLREASIAEGTGGAGIWFILAAQLHALGAREHLRARVQAGGTLALAIVLAVEIAFGAWLGYSSLKAAELIGDAGMFGPTNTAEVWVAIAMSAIGFLVLAVAIPVVALLLALPLFMVTRLMSRCAPVVAFRLLLLAPLGPVMTGAVGLTLMLGQLSKPIRGEMIMRVAFFRLADQSIAISLSLAGASVLGALIVTGMSRFRRLAANRTWGLGWRDAVVAVVAIVCAVALVLCAALVGRA
jgi:hypothetical protein